MELAPVGGSVHHYSKFMSIIFSSVVSRFKVGVWSGRCEIEDYAPYPEIYTFLVKVERCGNSLSNAPGNITNIGRYPLSPLCNRQLAKIKRYERLLCNTNLMERRRTFLS